MHNKIISASWLNRQPNLVEEFFDKVCKTVSLWDVCFCWEADSERDFPSTVSMRRDCGDNRWCFLLSEEPSFCRLLCCKVLFIGAIFNSECCFINWLRSALLMRFQQTACLGARCSRGCKFSSRRFTSSRRSCSRLSSWYWRRRNFARYLSLSSFLAAKRDCSGWKLLPSGLPNVSWKEVRLDGALLFSNKPFVRPCTKTAYKYNLLNAARQNFTDNFASNYLFDRYTKLPIISADIRNRISLHTFCSAIGWQSGNYIWTVRRSLVFSWGSTALMHISNT